MSIRIKLLLTYILLLIVSLFFLLSSGITAAGSLLQTASGAIFKEDIQQVAKETIDTIAELKSTSQIAPEKLVDASYIQEIGRRSEFYNGGLIVSYRGQYINDSYLPKDEKFYQRLIADERPLGEKMEDDVHSDRMVFSYEGKDYLYLDFGFDVQGEPVTYFFVADLSVLESVRDVGGWMAFRIVVILLLLIALPLILIIHFDILKPVKTLEKGVQQIQDGDLDFTLETKKKNELGRVIRSFDQMREKLKASIDAQVEYENNRKVFISSISHDLKTPITSIQGYVSGIQDGIADTPEKRDKYLRVISEKAKQMNVLIDDLFTLSKLDIDDIKLYRTPIPISDFLQGIVEEESVGLSDSVKIALVVEPEADKELLLDEYQMKRVITNIIHNSKKYCDKPQAEIEIRVTATDDNQVSIELEDNGKGIPQADLERIFDRFYRVDTARTSTEGGSGLGLAIAKRIIEAHGGAIRAQSGYGKGTLIVITLPIHPLGKETA